MLQLPLLQMSSDIFRFTVDFRKSFDEMKAEGNFDWHEGVNVFSIKRREAVIEFEGRYRFFDEIVSSDRIGHLIHSAETATGHWFPARVGHLLSFGAAFPNEQRKHPIVGLGSIAEINRDRDRSVPGLHRGSASERCLRSFKIEDLIDPIFRFLIVRKI